MQYDKYIYFIAFILVSLNGILVWSAVKTFEHKVKYFSSLIILMIFAWLVFLSYLVFNSSMKMVQSNKDLITSLDQNFQTIKKYNLQNIDSKSLESQILNSLVNSNIENSSALTNSTLAFLYFFIMFGTIIIYLLWIVYTHRKSIYRLEEEINKLKSITTDGNH